MTVVHGYGLVDVYVDLHVSIRWMQLDSQDGHACEGNLHSCECGSAGAPLTYQLHAQHELLLILSQVLFQSVQSFGGGPKRNCGNRLLFFLKRAHIFVSFID